MNPSNWRSSNIHEGVDRLLRHLWQELEPLEHLRIFTTLTDFYKDFRRSTGQEFIAYDMEFRKHLKRLEEIGAKIEGLTRAYWFLEKAGLSAELKKQVVAAAGGEYVYEKLRKALMAIVPKVKREEELSSRPSHPQPRQWKQRNQSVRQVNATTEEPEEEHNLDEPSEDGPEQEELEGELEVLLTQAAKKRAEIEKARGFAKRESSQERDTRIKQMKSKMPCSACKANGKTVYGHWHSDPECPYNKKAQGDRKVLAVVEEQLSDSESDEADLLPTDEGVFATLADMEDAEVWSSVDQCQKSGRSFTLALSDTCCARSVAGYRWMEKHMRHLQRLGEDVYVVDEARPFRFGGGPRIMSTHAVIIPLNVTGATRWAHLRVSVVDQEVPLLLSKTALKELGAVMDLASGRIAFKNMGVSVALRETKTGLCGFDVNVAGSGRRSHEPDVKLVQDGHEVALEASIASTHGPEAIYGVSSFVEPRGDNPTQEDKRVTKRIQTAECEDCARNAYKRKSLPTRSCSNW